MGSSGRQYVIGGLSLLFPGALLGLGKSRQGQGRPSAVYSWTKEGPLHKGKELHCRAVVDGIG